MAQFFKFIFRYAQEDLSNLRPKLSEPVPKDMFFPKIAGIVLGEAALAGLVLYLLTTYRYSFAGAVFRERVLRTQEPFDDFLAVLTSYFSA